jgi:hypothetical protein
MKPLMHCESLPSPKLNTYCQQEIVILHLEIFTSKNSDKSTKYKLKFHKPLPEPDQKISPRFGR